jgi:aspartate-semialdehyde dehydrogenase
VFVRQQQPVVAVVGASGVAGREILAVLEERAFPAREVRALASARSARERVPFGARELTVETLDAAALEGVDLAFFSAGPATAERFARAAVAAGTVVIDDSGVFADDPEVPLVVPEVDPGALAHHGGLVATPAPSVVQLASVLRPLHDAAGLRRVVVCTYQSASGAGRRAMDELRDQAVALLSFKEPKVEAFPRRLAFDCLPEVGALDADGAAAEERRLVAETRRVLGLADLALGVTCVRVPVFVGDAMAVHVELDRPLDPAAAAEALASRPGLRVETDPADYPTAQEAAGSDDVLVGRLRRDPCAPHGLALWTVADNVRRGGALNPVRIAELLLEGGRLRR